MERMDLHLDLSNTVGTKLNEDLGADMEIGRLEQDIACGINTYGKDVALASLQSRLVRVLADERVSEVAARLPKDTEVLLGGSSVLTPRRLIDVLRPAEQAGPSS